MRSRWYEEIPHGPLTERDFIKLGSVLQLSGPSDVYAHGAREVAERRLSSPEGALRHSIQKIMAEFGIDTEEPGGERNA